MKGIRWRKLWSFSGGRLKRGVVWGQVFVYVAGARFGHIYFCRCKVRTLCSFPGCGDSWRRMCVECMSRLTICHKLSPWPHKALKNIWKTESFLCEQMYSEETSFLPEGCSWRVLMFWRQRSCQLGSESFFMTECFLSKTPYLQRKLLIYGMTSLKRELSFEKIFLLWKGSSQYKELIYFSEKGCARKWKLSLKKHMVQKKY